MSAGVIWLLRPQLWILGFPLRIFLIHCTFCNIGLEMGRRRLLQYLPVAFFVVYKCWSPSIFPLEKPRVPVPMLIPWRCLIVNHIMKDVFKILSPALQNEYVYNVAFTAPHLWTNNKGQRKNDEWVYWAQAICWSRWYWCSFIASTKFLLHIQPWMWK
jgi:hypothetical protein